jgi:hypothetical protein
LASKGTLAVELTSTSAVDILPQVASGHGQIDLQVENDLSTSHLNLNVKFIASHIVLQCIFHPPALRTGIVILTNPKLSTCLFQFHPRRRQSILQFHLQVMMGQHLRNSLEKSGHDWLNSVKKISYQRMNSENESNVSIYRAVLVISNTTSRNIF